MLGFFMGNLNNYFPGFFLANNFFFLHAKNWAVISFQKFYFLLYLMIFKNFKNCPKNEISLLLQVRPITVYKTVHRSGDKNRTSRYPFQNFVFYYTVWILLFGILQSRSSTLLTSALCYIHSLYAFDIRK